MTEVFRYTPGVGPLLVSIPHSGTHFPGDIAATMTREALANPDCDCFLDRLYVFLRTLKIPSLFATHSRYVVDLNRPPDDSRLYRGTFTTGLFPELTFRGQPVYQEGKAPGEKEKKARLAAYYLPYHERLHQELEKIRAEYGYALLWDAHSIKSQVPTLFEGRLPDFNFGTNRGGACNLDLEGKFRSLLPEVLPINLVFDQRFIGGHITRHYGNPAGKIFAIQLELSQKTYIDEMTGEYEPDKAVPTMDLLTRLIKAYQEVEIP